MKKKNSKSGGLNTKILNKMSATAMPSAPPMPTLHLRGAHAKKFHGLKPGAKVGARIRGTLQNVGYDQYSQNNEPTADIQLSHIMPHGKPPMGGGGMTGNGMGGM